MKIVEHFWISVRRDLPKREAKKVYPSGTDKVQVDWACPHCQCRFTEVRSKPYGASYPSRHDLKKHQVSVNCLDQRLKDVAHVLEE